MIDSPIFLLNYIFWGRKLIILLRQLLKDRVCVFCACMLKNMREGKRNRFNILRFVVPRFEKNDVIFPFNKLFFPDGQIKPTLKLY